MTNRINHAAEAERALFVLDGVHGSDLSLDEFIAASQVHATLALVEQQRIANLIALWKDDDDAVALTNAGFSFAGALAEILAGLGVVPGVEQ